MNRRDCLKIAGAAAILPIGARVALSEPSQEPSTVQVALKRLMLRHTWTTTMSSSEYRDTVQVEYRRDGISGHGEGAPIIRYQEFPASAMQAIQAIAGEITAGDPWKYQKFLGEGSRTRSATNNMLQWLPSILLSSIGSARSSICPSTSFSGLIRPMRQSPIFPSASTLLKSHARRRGRRRIFRC